VNSWNFFFALFDLFHPFEIFYFIFMPFSVLLGKVALAGDVQVHNEVECNNMHGSIF
jgi:hypothetical protein